MPSTDQELAYFGGWTIRTFTGETQLWGDPRRRVVETQSTVPSSLIVPDVGSDLYQPGVPYYVINTGFSHVAIRRPNATLVANLVSGNSVMLLKGQDWYAFPYVGTPQFGTLAPALTLRVNLTQNEAEVNILAKCVALGYTGAQAAAVICTVRSGVAIGATRRQNRALSSGTTVGGVSWFAGSFWILDVEPEAMVGGWGGNGGAGGAAGTGSASGSPGENGGQAIRTDIPMRIDCRGIAFGGGGGGGGGNSSTTVLTTIGGGGGGGRGGNMTPTGVLIGAAGGITSTGGTAGTGGGPYSLGGGGLGVGNGGNGGMGGAAAAAGVAGWNVGNTLQTGGAGGTAAAAISYLGAAGAPTIIGGGGNIIGTIISEAS